VGSESRVRSQRSRHTGHALPALHGTRLGTVLGRFILAPVLCSVLRSMLRGAWRKDGDKLLSRVCSDRTRGGGFKLKEGRSSLDVRKKFFTVRVVRGWPRLPRAVGDAPSLEPFQARLDGALSTLIRLKMSLPMAGGWAGWP